MRVFVEFQSAANLNADAIGKPVVLYDDERLGSVERVVTAPDGRRFLVVTSSLFGTGKYYVPESEVRRVGPERILLSITRDDLRELDWLSAPEGVEG
jgi:hypothetical protein